MYFARCFHCLLTNRRRRYSDAAADSRFPAGRNRTDYCQAICIIIGSHLYRAASSNIRFLFIALYQVTASVLLPPRFTATLPFNRSFSGKRKTPAPIPYTLPVYLRQRQRLHRPPRLLWNYLSCRHRLYCPRRYRPRRTHSS